MNMFTSEEKKSREREKKKIPNRSQTHVNKRNASDEKLWNGDAFVMPTLSYSEINLMEKSQVIAAIISVEPKKINA